MENTGPDQYRVETGDTLLVVTATHTVGRVSVVGTFTEMRLALVGANAFAAEYDGERGKVVEYDVRETCLNQHGICPEVHVHTFPVGVVSLDADDLEAPEATKEQVLASPMLTVCPVVTKGVFGPMPDYAVVSGLVDGQEYRETGATLKWDLFNIEGCTAGDEHEARRVTGLPVCVEEPELDWSTMSGEDEDDWTDEQREAGEAESKKYDDLDAAVAFLKAGGTLCKVPDRVGSPHFRMLVVDVVGAPERGNSE